MPAAFFSANKEEKSVTASCALTYWIDQRVGGTGGKDGEAEADPPWDLSTTPARVAAALAVPESGAAR